MKLVVLDGRYVIEPETSTEQAALDVLTGARVAVTTAARSQATCSDPQDRTRCTAA